MNFSWDLDKCETQFFNLKLKNWLNILLFNVWQLNKCAAFDIMWLCLRIKTFIFCLSIKFFISLYNFYSMFHISIKKMFILKQVPGFWVSHLWKILGYSQNLCPFHIHEKRLPWKCHDTQDTMLAQAWIHESNVKMMQYILHLSLRCRPTDRALFIKVHSIIIKL